MVLNGNQGRGASSACGVSPQHDVDHGGHTRGHSLHKPHTRERQTVIGVTHAGGGGGMKHARVGLQACAKGDVVCVNVNVNVLGAGVRHGVCGCRRVPRGTWCVWVQACAKGDVECVGAGKVERGWG